MISIFFLTTQSFLFLSTFLGPIFALAMSVPTNIWKRGWMGVPNSVFNKILAWCLFVIR